jgi:type II secretory ATPase GspE/PulE/Tfp pilus assembly ATPase PilB-like protein
MSTDDDPPLPDEEPSPVVRVLNSLFAEVFKRGATHIHIDPDEDGVRVRMRIEGRLHEAFRLPRAIKAALTGRLKGIGRLDIAERRLPQQGRFTLELEGQRAEFHISTVPLDNRDERIVLRRVAVPPARGPASRSES